LCSFLFLVCWVVKLGQGEIIMAEENENTQPEPTPPETPQPPSGNTWWDWVKVLLPTNVKKIAFATGLTVILSVVNCFRVDNGQEPLPIPDIPLPLWPDGIVSPGVDGRNDALQTLRTFQGFAEFSETEANQLIVGADEDVPLWKFYLTANGIPIQDRDQLDIGSCVSFGYAGACELRIAVQYVTKKGGPISKVPNLVQEVIYGSSRVDVNGGRCPIPFGPDGRNDGSCGAWAVKALSSIGLLERKTYPNVDLTTYSVALCKKWGDSGVPADIKTEAKKNLCTYALVKNCEELLKSLQIGCPVAVCSSIGFGNVPCTRDGDGRLRAVNRWGHCMYIAGYRADIKSFLIINSWGKRWVNGPKGKYEDIPDGSFWADWATVERMLNNGNDPDSYAISGVNGFKRTKLKAEDWAVVAPLIKPKQPFLRGVDHAFVLAW
jgi:hypothetical protein